MKAYQFILNQMGGANKLQAMVNAKELTDTEAGLKFRFSGNRSINLVTIELNAEDTYDVRFYQLAKWICVPKGAFMGVYAEQLKECFENATGLRLSL